MIHLSWNCQGLGKPLTVKHLREITHFPSSAYYFLSETHQHSHYVDKVRKQFGYIHGFNVDPIGKAVWLSLWWKPDVAVDVLLDSKFFIDTLVTCRNTGEKFRVTWMYGPPYFSDKAAFWDSWKDQLWNDSTPWLVIGDLNELLWSFEKDGGAPWNSLRNRYLKAFIYSNGLIDIGFKGSSFTWYKKEFG
ncbi:hypothetical protein M0R45_000528 [Rubus argutus]|uniref:Uncharacterized protein n=1 Tax=Rubus argutus TaxID=59490 RepID=A0AAW1VN19_RUBAR